MGVFFLRLGFSLFLFLSSFRSFVLLLACGFSSFFLFLSILSILSFSSAPPLPPTGHGVYFHLHPFLLEKGASDEFDADSL